MELKLDLLDKKIISELNADVRISYSRLAKMLKTSKEVINYRIRRLEKEGIIRQYVTIFGFGYWAFKLLISFVHVGAKEESEIHSFLKVHPNVNWVTPCTGSYDLVLAIMAKDPEHFDRVLREITARIGKFIKDYKFSISIDSNTFGHTYLLDSLKKPGKIKRNTTGNLEFDGKDAMIARILHKNARVKMTEISAKTAIPFDTVKYRIRKMEENSIIKRYRLILDTYALGYHRYELFIKCQSLDDKTIAKFREYAESCSNIEFFSRCVGGWDIEYTAYFKTSNELRDFILNVKKEFGEFIQKFETVNLFETFNFVYFPQELRLKLATEPKAKHKDSRKISEHDSES